ncbi:DUF4336 domain-containing protein [Natronorubrum daqingense]|uniref:DUF4336 domain-containing protein n=1 Tax=Natronorubrum daqingense TaxID=588898 RepID=A0A1N6XN74_9EURY|nr:DUF4336 domain-containing protein [Natronorubrum daqingense]APX95904.1 hypothetical protein BB347_04335 [Natronorubrum daqingense]SIR03825.1 protein of unknown function [Natronorubrum daqingense]
MLTKRGERLWTYEEPLQFFGVEIGRIMSVMKLSSGGLFVQSPARLTPKLRAALADLGEVRFVAPASKLHGHLYMEQYRAAYPDVELLAAPGLPARRSDLRFDQVLGDTPDPRWGMDIDQVVVSGHRWLTEVAYFHRPSRTAILGDIGFHIDEHHPLKTRLVARALRMYRRVSPPIELRATIANEATFRRSIRDVLAWDFDRVIPGHGTIVETGGKSAVIEGYGWLLE